MNSLNSAQKQAVEHVSGPLLIVAGAGTGKTTVITEKIAYLISQKLATPEQILAVTFTDKAAGEMRDRVDRLVNTSYTDIQICTFHAFCQRLLESDGLDIGLPNQFRLFTTTDIWLLVRQNLNKFNLAYYRPLGNPARHIHELVKHFSKCKDELITPEEYLSYAQNIKLNKDDTAGIEKERVVEVADAYHVYNQLLLEHNALDFGDLIFYSIKLLKERPNILAQLRERYKYILVDEFQDVNWAQYQLVQMLTGDTGELTVVGDDDQSIYAFRGASVSNIMRFKEDYPQAHEIVLNENYRSRQEILDTAYRSIQNNNPDRLEIKLKLDKKLIAKSDNEVGKNFVAHVHAATLDDEVKQVVEEIVRLKTIDSTVTWNDFAILVRANAHADPFIARLELQKIPYEFLASAGLFRQPIVLDCVNFLKLIDDHHESTAVFRLLTAPFWQFGEFDLQKLTAHAKKKTITYYEAMKIANVIGISKEGLVIVEKLLNLIHTGLQVARTEKTSTVLYKFLVDSGYMEYMAHAENAGERTVIRQIYQLKQFFDYIQKTESANPENANVAGFLAHYRMVLDSGEKGEMYLPEDTPDSVNVLTVHSAKGLEFKYVFVVNLVEDRFPSRGRSEAIEIPLALIKEQLPEGDSRIEEERRLFYVAATRAKERLYFTSASDYGGSRAKKISRFLHELGYVVDTAVTSKKITNEFTTVTTAEKHDNTEIVYELPNKFSFSQIRAYNTCPYQYKLANILHLPTKGSASFSFGQTIHATLQEFYTRVQQLNSAHQGSLFGVSAAPKLKITTPTIPTVEELISIYDQKWIPDWYADKFQREKYYIEGKKILKSFYENNKDNWTVPVRLEGWFTIKVGTHTVHGRIDRIDQLPDGSLEIIDYKTGKAKEKLEADDKDQLLIYQIAASQLLEYRNVGPVQKLTFYYINEGSKLTFLGTEKEITKIQEKITSIIDKIQSHDFTANPNEHVCKHCDFHDICEFRA